jgi:UDP-glucose-4-epimerase GalE
VRILSLIQPAITDFAMGDRKHILVTGGAGYVGSHACKRLAAAGFVPVVIDSLSQGHRWAVKWGPLIVGDIADQGLVRGTIHRYGIRAVMHFAALAYVGESMQKPRAYFRNNVSNTLSLLETALDAGIDKVIFSSTCATYGDPIALPITEEHPQKPVNPYGASKLMVENVLHWYRRAYGLEYASLRYFNAAGADADGEIGEDHAPETHLIPLVIAAAQGRVPAVEIFGTDYDTADGTAIRDYIHVTDLAAAHVAALEYLIGGGESVSVNFGTGRGHSIREVVSAVERIGGIKVPVREADRRPGDPAVLIAEASRARAVLGWRPQSSELSDIIGTAWNWHRRGPVSDAGSGHPVRAEAGRAP